MPTESQLIERIIDSLQTVLLWLLYVGTMNSSEFAKPEMTIISGFYIFDFCLTFDQQASLVIDRKLSLSALLLVGLHLSNLCYAICVTVVEIVPIPCKVCITINSTDVIPCPLTTIPGVSEMYYL